MAGVGKLAKILVKMGQKDLVRNFSKAPLKTSLKTAGKAAMWPLKKTGQGIAYLHKKQGFKGIDDEGEWLVSNKYLYSTTGITLGAAGSTIYGGYEAVANHDEKKSAIGAAGGLGAVTGLILGGPIGGLIGAGTGFLLASCGSKSDETKPVETRQPEETTPVAEEETTVPEDSTETAEEEPAAAPADSTVTAPADSTATAPAVPVAPADSTATVPAVPAAPADSTATAPANPAAPADSTATAPAAPADSTATAPTAPVAPADSTATAPTAPATPTAPADSTETAPTAPAAPAQQPVQPQAPQNNLFGGTINEISIKEYDVKPDDCLWNIARRELEKANPGVTISNGQVLAQVQEFIRLNPQIKNPDLIYPQQKIKTAA